MGKPLLGIVSGKMVTVLSPPDQLRLLRAAFKWADATAEVESTTHSAQAIWMRANQKLAMAERNLQKIVSKLRTGGSRV